MLLKGIAWRLAIRLATIAPFDTVVLFSTGDQKNKKKDHDLVDNDD